MEYVRLMAQFQYTGAFGGQQAPLYDMPTYPHHPGFGAEANPAMAFSPLPQPYASPNPAQLPFQASLDSTVLNASPLDVPNPWRQSSVSSTPAVEHLSFLDSATPTPTESHLKLDMAPPVSAATISTAAAMSSPVADSPSGSNEEEAPTLSPSSFFWSEDEINVRLDKIMVDALRKIWETADRHKISLRTATFAVACERILIAREERGLYP